MQALYVYTVAIATPASDAELQITPRYVLGGA